MSREVELTNSACICVIGNQDKYREREEKSFRVHRIWCDAIRIRTQNPMELEQMRLNLNDFLSRSCDFIYEAHVFKELLVFLSIRA